MTCRCNDEGRVLADRGKATVECACGRCTFDTVEGNATGKGPNGERFQGVVTQVRALKDCRRLIRPGLCDLIQGASS